MLRVAARFLRAARHFFVACLGSSSMFHPLSLVHPTHSQRSVDLGNSLHRTNGQEEKGNQAAVADAQRLDEGRH